MTTPIENELGLGPVMHRFRRWSRKVISRLGNGAAPEDRRSLDPLTVNYAAWHEVRRTVREWPQYKEAANSLEILVSPEDWEDYWGIDSARKEAGVAAYVCARAAEKGYWIAGEPQIRVMEDDTIDVGEVEVVCQFVEPLEEEKPAVASGMDTAKHEPVQPRQQNAGATMGLPRNQQAMAQRQVAAKNDEDTPKDSPTLRFVDESKDAEAFLTDEHGFRLVLKPGDCIGAVSEDEEVPPEVNVRLDAVGFPYVESKQCSLEVVDGRWMVTNYSKHGTQLVDAKGRRLMLGMSEPYPIAEGDKLYLGPERPLRFELG